MLLSCVVIVSIYKQPAELIRALRQAYNLAIKVCPLQVFWQLTASFVESFLSNVLFFLQL